MRIEDISRVYVINLAKRADRWDAVRAAWEATGVELPLTRFVACDGEDYDPPKSWDVGRGAWGCYLSHISILVEAVRLGFRHTLILEDDAVFDDGFREKLSAVLGDLPTLYDQCYLGYQLLHTNTTPPSRITEHLGRGQNMNRNHATLYSRRGVQRILAHLTDLGEREKKEHIDHWLGRQIHEKKNKAGQNEYDCYIAIPSIVFQGAGKSNINGKHNPEHRWLYAGVWKTEPKPLVDILAFSTGYGTIGRGDYLGYDGLKPDRPTTGKTASLSLHAPSTVRIENRSAVRVCGYMNSSGGSGCDCLAVVDGQEIGRVKQKSQTTGQITLPPGEHVLEWRLTGKNNALAHTVWSVSAAD